MMREPFKTVTESVTHLRIFKDAYPNMPDDDGRPWILEGVDDFGNYAARIHDFRSHEEAVEGIPAFIRGLESEGVEFHDRIPRGFSIHD